jgi:hypothetical protein
MDWSLNRRNAVRTALLLTPLTLLASGGNAPQGAHFPDVTADSLSKQTLHLPADFGPGDTLVLIAFERNQQKDVDTWTAAEVALARQQTEFRFYEIPVLPWRDVFYRWWLNTAMRSGTPDEAARKRTVPVYLNKEGFRNSLQITTEKTISVLLLNKSGQVVWRTVGDWTEEKQRAMVYALDHP